MSESFEYEYDVLSIVSESYDFTTAFNLSGDGHNINESWVIEYMCKLCSENGFSYIITRILANRSDVRRKS